MYFSNINFNFLNYLQFVLFLFLFWFFFFFTSRCSKWFISAVCLPWLLARHGSCTTDSSALGVFSLLPGVTVRVRFDSPDSDLLMVGCWIEHGRTGSGSHGRSPAHGGSPWEGGSARRVGSLRSMPLPFWAGCGLPVYTSPATDTRDC